MVIEGSDIKAEYTYAGSGAAFDFFGLALRCNGVQGSPRTSAGRHTAPVLQGAKICDIIMIRQ
jgi:hypothetical protein